MLLGRSRLGPSVKYFREGHHALLLTRHGRSSCKPRAKASVSTAVSAPKIQNQNTTAVPPGSGLETAQSHRSGVWGKVRTVIFLRRSMILGRSRLGSSIKYFRDVHHPLLLTRHGGSAVLEAEIKIASALPPGSGPETAQNQRSGVRGRVRTVIFL